MDDEMSVLERVTPTRRRNPLVSRSMMGSAINQTVSVAALAVLYALGWTDAAFVVAAVASILWAGVAGGWKDLAIQRRSTPNNNTTRGEGE